MEIKTIPGSFDSSISDVGSRLCRVQKKSTEAAINCRSITRRSSRRRSRACMGEPNSMRPPMIAASTPIKASAINIRLPIFFLMQTSFRPSQIEQIVTEDGGRDDPDSQHLQEKGHAHFTAQKVVEKNG